MTDYSEQGTRKRRTDNVSSARIVRERTVFRVLLIAGLLAFCIAGFLISICLGSLKLSIEEVVKAVFLHTAGLQRQIIWNIRLPRTLVAGMVGMSLSLSGAILQGVLRNPLAAPNIIGVSSGAGLAAMIVLIAAPDLYHLLIPASFIGALVTTLIIYLLAWQRGIKPMRMVLAGVAVSALLGAGINALMLFYPERVQGVIGFLVGSLSSRTWKHVNMLWPYTLGCFVLVTLFAKRLNILMLGDEPAVGLGLRVEQTRFIFIAISSLLAAGAVSVAGLLGFIGLIVPHIMRILIGSDYRFLFPASALCGAGLLMVCDTASRIILDPMELPVGIITAALGSPLFLYLLRGGLRHET